MSSPARQKVPGDLELFPGGGLLAALQVVALQLLGYTPLYGNCAMYYYVADREDLVFQYYRRAAEFTARTCSKPVARGTVAVGLRPL
jgi:hypothetical protein